VPHETHLSDPVGILNPRCPDCQQMVRAWLPSRAVRVRFSEVDGWMLELENESIREAVQLAIAAASLCWIPAPTGEFQQQWAGQIADELVRHLRKLRFPEGFS
jgi:hypothetical protein